MVSEKYPRQGEIYLIRALKNVGDTKKRPAVVVSLDLRNQLSNMVLVVPFTSDLKGGETPTRILLRAGEGGLTTDSLAMCDYICTVGKNYLERGSYGEITSASLRKIQEGISIALGIF
jgi:mRNA interferase MazF